MTASRRPAGGRPSWAATVPYNRHDALGHVDWVSEAGRPVRATLHADGKWSATTEDLAALLDAFWAPEVLPDVDYGADSLAAVAGKVGGRVTLAHPDLALPGRGGGGDEAGGAVLDG